ncbi:ubiquitin carboxyl-terminal hydrolase 32 isoform X2 [Teleopsis dalmanni]|uniref:ubiquitin carboxyl-terminal hydrolase 32 isoform X2 n=1 Tax=Teleopsis dalmanni TaxID=139649 RepID=UPI0018CF0D5A|nr:ubiquitin carboxyl-terminal hydrolase 32 isoform X2 [Teleopsis dalmanni]
MGAKESKQLISFDDAVKRVTESELRRLKDAFKKSAGVGRLYLSRNSFQQDVLCEGVPPNITDLLYSACGGSAKGISFKDLLCGLVLLTRGTEDEKVRFLWNLYCNDAGTYIIKSEYIKNVNLHPFESVSLFAQNDRINFDQYHDWILQHKSSTILSKWLLSSDRCINLTSELETPTFYQSLAGVTHLEEKDISDLEKEFWQLKNDSPNGQLDLQLLAPLLSPPIPKNALIGLFNAFDENRDGHIDFKELCCGVSAACRGPTVERTRFCYKIFDIDQDGSLNHEETIQMINVLIFVAKENRNSNIYKDLKKQDVISDLLSFKTRKSEEVKTKLEPCVSNKDNILLTAEDFMMWSVESNSKLVQPFLDLIFEVCHIVFGLWPQCRHMEYDIVRGWLKREEKRQYSVGQFWYLVSREWWMSWMQYSQNTSTPCDYCKKTISQRNSNVGVVDEALICDESFNSNYLDISGDAVTIIDNCSIGSVSSGVSTGQYGRRPGPIDNTNLITPNPYKNVRTLTGEGGHLKRDTPLVQNHDFELVPKSLWKALNRWYGHNLPLPRQVIQPPNSTSVELELYPLNLRILLHQSMPNNATVNSWGAVSGGYGVMASGGGYAAISASNVLQPPKRYLAYTAAFSRLATIRQIGEFLCVQLRLRPDDVRLWHIPAGSLENSAILLEEDNMTLKELVIKDNDQILLEIRNKDLTWPEELGSLTLNQNSTVNDRRLTRTSIMSVHAPGATGLHNLGNTCFMNAALQVLFNTQPLAQYFHRDMHMFEINRENKLGTRGQLATRYGELLKEVWTATTRSVAPLKLRICVTKHASQFAGGGQHDSQELLEWFLDALHEDLNRVMDKTYSELKDSNGRSDKIVAAEAWAQHHARNQSIIIDLFYGQLKSKVSCLGCGKESVRFDPFSLLSLPLPVENFIYFEVLVILLDGSVPIKYGLRLNSESKYIELKRKLATLSYLNPNYMLVCEIWNSQIRQILADDQKIKPATAKELYVYQLPEECNYRSRSSSTLGISIEKGLKDIQRSSALISGQDSLSSLNTSFNNINQTQPTSNFASQYKTHMSFEDGANGATCQLDDDEDDEDDEQVSTKVRRCFGNTMCMPQNLLCFKQTPDLSRSPENTFVSGTQKSVSSAKLLHGESVTCSSSLTHHSGENSMESSTTETLPIDPMVSMCDNDNRLNNATSKLNSTEFSNESTDYSKNFGRTYKESSFRDNSGNSSIGVNENEIIQGQISNNCIQTESICNGIFSRVPSQHYKVGKYLVAVHRKITRQDSYFLSYHKTRPSLFGVPLLIPNSNGGTHKDLYCAVWLQVSRLLSPLPASTDQANHAADCDDSLGYDFPFTLRAVKKDGLTCALCGWSDFCRGCEIPCNNDYLLQGFVVSGSPNTSNSSTPKMTSKYSSLPNLETRKHQPEYLPSISHNTNSSLKTIDDYTIAIDWDPTALHLRYQSTLERLWSEHETISICRKEQIEPVDLNHCLRAFTSEEKLEQWYHCGHCKGKKPATKKLQIWKLPPILIVHLKRFNCVNGKWVKSQKSVHFPFDDFDPTPYLASVPQETILRHKELLELRQPDETIEELEMTNEDAILNEYGKEQQSTNNTNNGNNVCNEAEVNISLDNAVEIKNQTNYQRTKLDNCSNVVTISEDVNEIREFSVNNDGLFDNSEMNTNTLRNKCSGVERRKRLISTSLTKTPIVDGEFEDFHQHMVKTAIDKFDPKYKLYAVVSHSGMLNGGHYVSYAANQNGSWYCYNDSSCREITNQPTIDPSSAYLLFYERKGLDYEPYLPNFEGKSLPNGGVNMDIDETESDLKKLCNIS